jgi:hypothetical protein
VVLSTYQRDPAVIVSLAIKLLKPVKFTQALTLASEESLIRALESPAPSANILAITIIEKAATAPSDAAILSIMNGVVASFLRTWLSSPSVEVGEKATKALGDLLDVDCDRTRSSSINAQMNGLEITVRSTPGQGLLWRRIFNDKDIYSSIFSLCSHDTIGTGVGQLDERQKSLAQARLLRILPRLAGLDFNKITHSDFPDIDARYGLEDGDHGLLYFAATEMIDQDDILMRLTRQDFFREFLDIFSQTEFSKSALQYVGGMMKTVIEDDPGIYKSLESLALSPTSSPELVELLQRLNEYL